MPLRICAVTFTDSRGIRHTVEVSAESLFEAAILGPQTLKQDSWTEPIGPATKLEVEIREPVARHTVTMLQVQRWLEGATPSPNERVKKDRLKQLLVTK
jgi:hypothetical protein